MQLKLINAVLCSNVIRDAENNAISLIGIVENLTLEAKEFPEQIRLPVKLEIFTHWMRENSEIPCSGTFQVNYLLPSGESHKLMEMGIDLETHCFHRGIIKVEGMELHGPGLYGFQIAIKNADAFQPIHTIPLLVTFKPERDVVKTE